MIGKHEKTAVTKAEQDELDKIVARAEGTIAESLVAKYVAGVNDGIYQVHPCTDSPRRAIQSVAMGVLIKNLIGIAQGVAPADRQAVLVLDPVDGPGAGQRAEVVPFVIDTKEEALAQAMLLGAATEWGAPVWQDLKGVLLVEHAVTKDGKSFGGTLGVVYGFATPDGLWAQRASVVIGGGFASPVVVEPADRVPSAQIIYAMHKINTLVKPLHREIKQK